MMTPPTAAATTTTISEGKSANAIKMKSNVHSSDTLDTPSRLHGRGGRQRQRYRRSVGDYAEMFAAMMGEGARTFESIKRLPWYHKK